MALGGTVEGISTPCLRDDFMAPLTAQPPTLSLKDTTSVDTTGQVTLVG